MAAIKNYRSNGCRLAVHERSIVINGKPLIIVGENTNIDEVIKALEEYRISANLAVRNSFEQNLYGKEKK